MSTPTPPPPPSFPTAPPPGYTAYEPNNWGAGLSRVKPLALWLTVLLGVIAVAQLASLATIGSISDAAEDYLAGTMTADDFDGKIGVFGIFGGLIGFAQIAVIVLSIVWLYRVVRNHAALDRSLRWGPGWAIGGWFAPPFLFIIPLLLLRETWKASDPAVPAGSPVASRRGEQPLIWLWFALYVVAQTAITVATGSPFEQFSSDRTDLAKRFVDDGGLLIAQSLIGAASAVAWFLVVRVITNSHAELTGENRAR